MKTKLIFIIALSFITNSAFAMFEATSVPAPKTSPPRFTGSRVKLNAALPIPNAPNGKQRIACLWSLAKKVDPIIQGGIFPSNHLHDFYGNPTINEFSTAASLQLPTTGSSCSGGSEYKSSFWFPSIVDTANNNKYQGTSQVLVYYASNLGLEDKKVQPIPMGLKMVIGKMNNTDPSKNLSKWSCFSQTAPYTTRIDNSPTLPTCVAGERLRELLRFNQCLKLKANGQPYLDTDTSTAFTANDHQQHLVPARTGDWETNPAHNECPTGYMLIPQVTLIRDYTINTGNTSGWRLVTDASDMSNPGGTAHADYFMAMPAKWMNMITTNCINASAECEVGRMGIDPTDGISKALIQ